MNTVDILNEKADNKYEYGIYRLSNSKVFPKNF